MAERDRQVTKNPYWEPVNKLGLVWRLRTSTDVLSVITFYTMRGHERASFWRSIHARLGEKSCFSLQEAKKWAEQ